MMDEQELRVDPNSADLETLTKLPGIGPELAKRIVDARPFESPKDLLRVTGLGETALDEIRPYLIFSSREPALSEMAGRVQAQVGEWREDAGQILGERIEEWREETRQAGEKIQKLTEEARANIIDAAKRASETVAGLPAAFNRVETLWLVLGVGVISIVLSVITSLTILAGINRTLNFERHTAIRQLTTELADVRSDLDNETFRLDAVSQRLEVLEGLSGRMTAVEGQVDSMQEEMDGALSQVETMQTTVDELSQRTHILAGSVERFDRFLDGLYQLLSGLFVPVQPDVNPLP